MSAAASEATATATQTDAQTPPPTMGDAYCNADGHSDSDADSDSHGHTDSDTTPTATPSDDLQVRIIYSGAWTGTVGDEASTRSIQDDGTMTVDVTDDTMVVTVNAQKQAVNRETLTVQILKGDEVLKEARPMLTTGWRK